MTTEETRKAKPYELECGHVLWLKIAPNVDEPLWCSRCTDYKDQTLKVASTYGSWIVYPDDDFQSYRLDKYRYLGMCLADNCKFEIVKRGWFQLRESMHNHYMKAHTRFSPSIVIESAERLPKNATPPF